MTSPTSATPAAFAACVGLDWADEQHEVVLQMADGSPLETTALPQTPEALEEWTAGLRQRFPGQRVAVCLESSRSAVVFGLMHYEFLVLYPINPKQLSDYRKAMYPSGAKDDPHDAALLLEFLQKHRDKLRPWRPDDPQTRLIAQLAEDRRDLVQQQTRLANQLRDRLKQFFPQALQLVDELDRRMACQFLRRWPSLQRLQRARTATVRNFYRAHRCRSETVEKRLQWLQQARPLCSDSAVVESGERFVSYVVDQLLRLADAIQNYEHRLVELVTVHPDGALFSSFPGAGQALTPRLVAAFGTDRDRFTEARQIQNFSGIAPVTKRSGKSCHVQRRRACPKFLRQTFHELAHWSLPHCLWAKAYYDMLKARGAKHHAAVRALAFKWIRVLFRCWQSRTRYDDAAYLAQLQKKNSPLLAYLPATETLVTLV